MKTQKISILFCLGLWGGIPAGSSIAASTIIGWHNSQGTELRDLTGIPLSEGSSTVAADGDLVQLGYYASSTTSNPFLGPWVTLQSNNIGAKSSDYLGDGRYYHSYTLSAAKTLLGVPLSVRFYDSPSMETATFFNAVTDSTGAWNMKNAPTETLIMTLSLSDSALVWQDGIGSAFRTTISIPEPESGATLLFAAALLGSNRSGRKAKRR